MIIPQPILNNNNNNNNKTKIHIPLTCSPQADLTTVHQRHMYRSSAPPEVEYPKKAGLIHQRMGARVHIDKTHVLRISAVLIEAVACKHENRLRHTEAIIREPVKCLSRYKEPHTEC